MGSLALQKCNKALSEGKNARNADFLPNYLQDCADLAVKNFDSGCFGEIKSQCSQSLRILEGDFRAAILDGSGQCLLLVTSAFNPQTLFYIELSQFPGTFAVSCDIEALLPLVSKQVCQTALSFWLAGRPDPNLSLYANIHQVPQGGMVLLSPDRAPQEGQFWDIDTTMAESTAFGSAEEYQQQLWALLQNSVGEVLPQSNTFFSQLSGGMDSTSVSATAFQLAEQRMLSMQSMSHTYVNTDSADERDNIHAMIALYPFTHSHFIELDKYADYRFSEVYPTHAQSPGMVLSPKYHQEAQLMVDATATTLLTGNGGDEMFWGHSLAYFDRLSAGEWGVIAEVIRSARTLKLPVVGALRSVFLSPLKQQFKSRINGTSVEQTLAAFAIPKWLTEQARTQILDAKQRPNPFAGQKHDLARYARYEGLFQTSTFNAMRSYQAVFDQYGLKVQHPLFNKHIAQFSFDVPQHLHISGAYPKLLLRQTMNQHLPKQVCWNQKKTVFDQHFAKLLKHNQEEIRSLLEHEALADLGLISNREVLATFDTVMASPTPSLQVDLLYAILVQSWYQTHIV